MKGKARTAIVARIVAARRRHTAGYYEVYYEATTRLLQGYYEATKKSTTRLLRGLLRGYYYKATKESTYYEATKRSTTRLLTGAARAPLGQQHRSSRTARLPAPLNPAARSRRRRSAHREKDLEDAVLHV
jgi:hypothetical protein